MRKKKLKKYKKCNNHNHNKTLNKHNRNNLPNNYRNKNNLRSNQFNKTHKNNPHSSKYHNKNNNTPHNNVNLIFKIFQKLFKNKRDRILRKNLDTSYLR